MERPNPSYVSTVNAFVNVKIEPEDNLSVLLDAPQLNSTSRGSIDPEGRIIANVPKELLLLKTCAEVTSRYAAAKGVKIQGFSIHTKSDEAFSYYLANGKIGKSGLGSSAALSVATVRALSSSFEMNLDNEEVHKLAQTAHSIATGKVGSGFDIAAATYGDIVYVRYSPEIITALPNDFSNDALASLIKSKWDYSIEPLGLPKNFRVSFASFIGESMITTASIGSVSEFKKKDPELYNETIKELNYANVEAISSLKAIANGKNDSMDAFKEAFEEGRAMGKELGVLSGVDIEPDDCTALIGESKKNGAFVAKLPGAGGKDSIAALSISDTDVGNLLKFWHNQKGLTVIDLNAKER